MWEFSSVAVRLPPGFGIVRHDSAISVRGFLADHTSASRAVQYAPKKASTRSLCLLLFVWRRCHKYPYGATRNRRRK